MPGPCEFEILLQVDTSQIVSRCNGDPALPVSLHLPLAAIRTSNGHPEYEKLCSKGKYEDSLKLQLCSQGKWVEIGLTVIGVHPFPAFQESDNCVG